MLTGVAGIGSRRNSCAYRSKRYWRTACCNGVIHAGLICRRWDQYRPRRCPHVGSRHYEYCWRTRKTSQREGDTPEGGDLLPEPSDDSQQPRRSFLDLPSRTRCARALASPACVPPTIRSRSRHYAQHDSGAPQERRCRSPQQLYARLRRRLRPSAERPSPSNASVAGSGTAPCGLISAMLRPSRRAPPASVMSNASVIENGFGSRTLA